MTLNEIRNLSPEKKRDLKLSDLLLPKQQEAFRRLGDDRTVEVLYGGAAGGGKSYLGSLWLIMNCVEYPGSRWMMGRSVLKTLKETTLNTFLEVCGALGYANHIKYNQQTGIIKWWNGSEILLKDLFAYPRDPNFESLGSLEITGAFIDECSQITHKAKQIVKSRVRYKLNEFGVIPKLLMTCNPSKNWVHKEFYTPYKKGEMAGNKCFIPALVTDNPYLPESYIESLKTLDEVSKQRLLYGNFDYDSDPNALIEHDAIMDMFENDHVQEGDKVYMSCDIATRGSDRFRIGIWKGWVLVDEEQMERSNGKEVVERIRGAKQRWGIPNSRIVYDADGVGSMVDGFFNGARAFINNSRALNGENYENLKTQAYYKLAERINKRELWWKKKMTPDEVEEITVELGQVKRRDADSDGKLKILRKDEIKENIGRSPDWADMMMMRCYFDLDKGGLYSTGVR